MAVHDTESVRRADAVKLAALLEREQVLEEIVHAFGPSTKRDEMLRELAELRTVIEALRAA